MRVEQTSAVDRTAVLLHAHANATVVSSHVLVAPGHTPAALPFEQSFAAAKKKC
jgi:hypothetical protein